MNLDFSLPLSSLTSYRSHSGSEETENCPLDGLCLFCRASDPAVSAWASVRDNIRWIVLISSALGTGRVKRPNSNFITYPKEKPHSSLVYILKVEKLHVLANDHMWNAPFLLLPVLPLTHYSVPLVMWQEHWAVFLSLGQLLLPWLRQQIVFHIQFKKSLLEMVWLFWDWNPLTYYNYIFFVVLSQWHSIPAWLM